MPDDSTDSPQDLYAVTTDDECSWDRYVRSHSNASHYHLYGWRSVIQETYGHRTVYLAVKHPGSNRAFAGVLPLIQLRHPLRGNRLVSMPFADTGGILADNPAIEQILLTEALRRGYELKAKSLELRQTAPLAGLRQNTSHWYPACQIRSHKVSLSMELGGSADHLRSTFKSKLRSQVRKAEKNGLQTETGNDNLLDDFYAVFARNMRDLGSPVHSLKLFKKVLEAFKDDVRIVIVRRGHTPLAAGFTLVYKDAVLNPWASSLKEFRHLASNMLLYWAMLEYASNGHFRRFDFGRSSPGAGACRFKQQWGAIASPLFWHNFSLNGKPPRSETLSFRYWNKLPVPLATLLGPSLRKRIGL